jgi:pimeloyl-ACP methyl ester carboxylesterase
MPTLTTPDDVTIHYETVGQGRDVVLVHGITDSMKAWGPIPDLLAPTYRVTTIDLRGHGSSGDAADYSPFAMANDVALVMAAIGAVSPLAIGHSLGGFVVTVYSSVAEVRGTVNVDQPLHLAGFQEGLRQVAPMLRDPDTFRSTYDSIVLALDGDVLSDEMKAEIAAQRRPRREVVLGIWNTVIDTPAAELDELVRQGANAIIAPYLALLFGDAGPDYERWLHELIPQAVVEVWPGLGHYGHRIHPQRFVERVIAFDSAG